MSRRLPSLVPRTPYEAILFDFDGVLADTEALHFERWAEALEQIVISLVWQTFKMHCIGIPYLQVAAFFRGLGLSYATSDNRYYVYFHDN